MDRSDFRKFLMRKEMIKSRSKRLPRAWEHNPYPELNLPPKKTCAVCKNFISCNGLGHAIATDTTCSYVPNNFALPGQESKAERLNREDMEAFARMEVT